MKALQKFTDDYLEQCNTMKPEQIAQFLDDFRKLHGDKRPKQVSKLISMKVDESLLEAFRFKCNLEGIPYQTMIKKLMANWLG